MYKIVILRQIGFDIISFNSAAMADRNYAHIIQDNKGSVIGVFMYGPNDDLITCTGVRI